MRERLSFQQRALFDFLRGVIGRRGYPPTIDEIRTHMGYTSTAPAWALLNRLREKGYVAVTPRVNRGIRILPATPLPRRMTADEQMLNDRIAALDSPTLVIYADRTKAGEFVGFTAYDAGAEIVHERQAEGC